ncbi:MAG: alpha-glucosidase [Clostridiales bacterium]|nr:alpha-glucosidase [Clostridiales bacterium]
MIYRYDFGTPLETGAIVSDVPVCSGDIRHFTAETDSSGPVSLTIRPGRDDILFGLGETLRSMNKRGYLYRSWNMDDFSHTENKHGIYASHNLLLFTGECGLFGVYIDDPGDVRWDLGYTDIDLVRITSVNGNFSCYIIEEDSLTGICRTFRKLTGRSYIPPPWAFGYIQSRWGYASSEDAERVLNEHRTRHIPLDAVSMDIDYMDRYMDFTWDKDKIPDLKKLCADMRSRHARLIPIIDAGVKQLDGYSVYDEGAEKGFFCKKADGTDFVAGVWPGYSCFPDFFRPAVRTWFGRKYHAMMDAGIEGFWNDMNEPALFYTPEKLQEMRNKARELLKKDAPLTEYETLKHIGSDLPNNDEDYRRFYHVLNGKTVRHDTVHNIYGAHMTMAAAEGAKSFDPDKRFLLFSRSSFAGAHRCGGVWQGDNSSWWSHILLNLRMMPSLNMAGFLYCGADLGGFSCDTTEDLMTRWLQLGVFTPLMRNHSALGAREQEVYRFSTWQDMRSVIRVRYALIPYLYSEFMKCALTDSMMYRPLAFDYPEDPLACRVEDQVMLGEDCMIAPVYEQNARGRCVYLPEAMLMIRFRSPEDADLIPLGKGHHYIDLALNEFPLFIRRGHIIPLVKAAESTDDIDTSSLFLYGWIEKDTSFTIYDDDGFTTAPDLEKGLRHIQVSIRDGKAAAGSDGLSLSTDHLILM